MKKLKKLNFKSFVKKFPEIAPPLTIGENTHQEFSKHNDPLSDVEILHYIQAYENQAADEYTEYVPCFRIPNKNFHALVYWRAGLMDYRYILVTYNKKGDLIAQRVIAGLYSDGTTLTQSVATIDADWGIAIGTGQSDAKTGKFDIDKNTIYEIELMPDGTIELA